MTASLMLVGSIVVLICSASVSGFLRHGRQADLVQSLGSVLLLVMVFTHVAEHFHLLMAMRWGSLTARAIISIWSARLVASGFSVVALS